MFQLQRQWVSKAKLGRRTKSLNNAKYVTRKQKGETEGELTLPPVLGRRKSGEHDNLLKGER